MMENLSSNVLQGFLEDFLGIAQGDVTRDVVKLAQAISELLAFADMGWIVSKRSLLSCT